MTNLALRPGGRYEVNGAGAGDSEGTTITDTDGNEIGCITSGGFGPSLGGPMAMGYVAIGHAKPDTAVNLIVRGKVLPARVARMPFVPQSYYRG